MPKDFHQTEWDALVEDEFRRLVRAAMLEDLDREQDWTTVALVPHDSVGAAAIVARRDGVVAGLPCVAVLFDETDQRVHAALAAADGQRVRAGDVLATIDGPARSLLTLERPLLNFLGRLSGIATLTQQFVDTVAGTAAKIYDTRKTTPGWRRLEKYAVRQGGGQNHRTGLFDAILIKDNHLALGHELSDQERFSPREAVRQARQFLAENFPAADPRREMICEVEVDSLQQFEEVLVAQPDIVLLDNMPCELLRRAVALRDAEAPSVQLEASGGVSLASVASIAQTGVDRISTGALTHSAVWFDVALDWI